MASQAMNKATSARRRRCSRSASGDAQPPQRAGAPATRRARARWRLSWPKPTPPGPRDWTRGRPKTAAARGRVDQRDGNGERRERQDHSEPGSAAAARRPPRRRLRLPRPSPWPALSTSCGFTGVARERPARVSSSCSGRGPAEASAQGESYRVTTSERAHRAGRFGPMGSYVGGRLLVLASTAVLARLRAPADSASSRERSCSWGSVGEHRGSPASVRRS